VLSLARNQGDGGVRDPCLIRSPEGDRFFLIAATDLSIYYRGGWGNANATVTGSKKIVVWESTDLAGSSLYVRAYLLRSFSSTTHARASPSDFR